jgi:predicted transcriptional regulator of viral defense system
MEVRNPGLPSELIRGPFTSNQAEERGVSHYKLRLWLKSKQLKLLARGIYCLNRPLKDDDYFQAAVLRTGEPSAIGLLSALAFYSLAKPPEKIWVLVPETKRTIFTDLRLVRTRRPHWKTGIEDRDSFQISNVERSLVDSLFYLSAPDLRIAQSALRKAVATRKTSREKVLEMATNLGIPSEIQTYLKFP